MRPFSHFVFILFRLLQDAIRFLLLGTRSKAALRAENLFLRKQIALYLEREVKPRRADDATRLSMVLLSRLFAWEGALANVKPETFLGWHREGFRLLWRWKSRPRGRPRVPERLQELIFKMAHENPTWGEERIAAELLLKLGIRVSPRTVRRYMPLEGGPRKRVSSQRWMTFVRNHAQAILACDFFVVVTARFRILYVFVIMEVGTRRITHFNVTAVPRQNSKRVKNDTRFWLDECCWGGRLDFGTSFFEPSYPGRDTTSIIKQKSPSRNQVDLPNSLLFMLRLGHSGDGVRRAACATQLGNWRGLS